MGLFVSFPWAACLLTHWSETWSVKWYIHTPSAGPKFEGFCEIMHLKTFSKLEYVGIGQGKTSVQLTATQSLDSLPEPDPVFVIFLFLITQNNDHISS